MRQKGRKKYWISIIEKPVGCNCIQVFLSVSSIHHSVIIETQMFCEDGPIDVVILKGAECCRQMTAPTSVINILSLVASTSNVKIGMRKWRLYHGLCVLQSSRCRHM